MPEYLLTEEPLTEAECAAKEAFLSYFREGYKVPCDTQIEESELPPWYDELKYKRGQKYFHDNRVGILNSNFTALICLLAEPKGLTVLASTGRSSNKMTARKRYISTVLHTISWYGVDLTPGSQSRKSLNLVRKMHFLASRSSVERNIGFINQSELAITAFGFMGFPLIRPHILGIRHDNREDLEAFVHVWAVLCHMIGVQEKFNICLLPFDTLIVLCQMILRYILIPLIQVERPLFRDMTQALLDGMTGFLPHMDYESQIFLARRLCCVPGYQYDVQHDQEKLCRSILTRAEIDECNEVALKLVGYITLPISYDIPVIQIELIENSANPTDSLDDDIATEATESADDTPEYRVHQTMQLSAEYRLTIKYVNYETEWLANLNDSQFYSISPKSQNIMRRRSWGRRAYDYQIPRYLMECGVSLMLRRMTAYLKSFSSQAQH